MNNKEVYNDNIYGCNDKNNDNNNCKYGVNNNNTNLKATTLRKISYSTPV